MEYWDFTFRRHVWQPETKVYFLASPSRAIGQSPCRATRSPGKAIGKLDDSFLRLLN